MPHQIFSRLALLVASTLAVGAAHAQEPKTDVRVKGQAEQTRAPANSTPAQTASGGEQSTKAEAAKTASNSTPLQTIVVNGGASADILRSARNAGFKIKVVDGKTHFCKTEASIGSRFSSESCMNEQQVTLWLDRAQDQRDKIQNLLGAPASAH